MKKPKRYMVRVAYGYRISPRAKRQKTPSDNNKTTSPDHLTPQGTLDETPVTTTDSPMSGPLATFNRHCNPYQQFVDNLSVYLTNLPRETFTKKPEQLAVATKQEEPTETQTTEELEIPEHLEIPEKLEPPRKGSNEHHKINHKHTDTTTTSSPRINPNLQNLLGIASCLLASNH